MSDRPAVAALRAEWERIDKNNTHVTSGVRDLVERLLAALENAEQEGGSFQRAANAWEQRAVEAEARERAALEAPGPQSAVEAAAQALGGLAGRQRRERGEAPPEPPADAPGVPSAEFLAKYESIGHWCPNGDRVRPYSFAVCSMCMGMGAVGIVQLRVRGEAGPLPPIENPGRVEVSGGTDGGVGAQSPPVGLDATALAAAERAYWKDPGVSRHNLAAAIRVYLGAVRAGPLPPEPLRRPNNPHEAAQLARLEAGDREGFKRELLKSVQLYADVEAGRTCMGSPVIAENVLAGIAHQIDMLGRAIPAPQEGPQPPA